jgi:hypothetical protein
MTQRQKSDESSDSVAVRNCNWLHEAQFLRSLTCSLSTCLHTVAFLFACGPPMSSVQTTSSRRVP